jgi:hypothetical protein
MMVVAPALVRSTSMSMMALVPLAKLGISATPSVPFHIIVSVPLTSMSWTVFLCMAVCSSLEAFFGDEIGQIGDAAGVAPLVIVPCNYFDHIATGDHR